MDDDEAPSHIDDRESDGDSVGNSLQEHFAEEMKNARSWLLDLANRLPASQEQEEQWKLLLWHATRTGNVDRVRSLLDAHPEFDLDSKFRGRDCVLKVAAESGHAPVVSLLVEKGATMTGDSVRGSDGNLPWHLSVMMLWRDSTLCMLRHGIDIDCKAKNGRTALHVLVLYEHVASSMHAKGIINEEEYQQRRQGICADGDEHMLELLLDNGAQVDLEDDKGHTALTFAAMMGNRDAVERLLDHGANLTHSTHTGRTALHWAVVEGHKNTARCLLQRGADPSLPDEDGTQPLHLAASHDQGADMCRLLIEAGAGVEARTQSRITPLHNAAYSGCVDTVRLLLSHDASPRCLTRLGQTALMKAAANDHPECAVLLLAAASPVNFQDYYGQTALFSACSNGYARLVRVFLSAGADQRLAQEDGLTCLRIASRSGFESVVEALLTDREYLDTAEGWAELRECLLQAVLSHELRVVQLLLSQACASEAALQHVMSVDAETGRGPLHVACLAGSLECAQELIAIGAEVNAKSVSGVTPLHMACKSRCLAVVKHLIVQQGADVHALDEDGWGVLAFAVDVSCDVVIEYLLDDTDVCINSVDPDKPSALHIAMRNGNTDIANLLLTRGADLNTPHKNGTPLDAAFRVGKVEAAEWLLEKGAESAGTDVFEQTPLQVAAHRNHEHVVRFILDNVTRIPGCLSKDYVCPQSMDTALHFACLNENVEVVETLLQHNCDTELLNDDGMSPLQISVKLGNLRMMAVLLANRAQVLPPGYPQSDVDQLKDWNAPSSSALHLACERRDLDASSALLRAVADEYGRDSYMMHDVVNFRDLHTGEHPLHVASRQGDLPLVDLLVEHGARVDTASKNGATALHEAADGGNVKVISRLLDHGGKLFVSSNGQRIAHGAAFNGHVDVLRLLVDRVPGAVQEMDAMDECGRTPLFWAAANGHVTVVAMLLQYNVRRHVLTKDKETPLIIARKHNNHRVVSLLEMADMRHEVGLCRMGEIASDMYNDTLQGSYPEPVDPHDDPLPFAPLLPIRRSHFDTPVSGVIYSAPTYQLGAEGSNEAQESVRRRFFVRYPALGSGETPMGVVQRELQQHHRATLSASVVQSIHRLYELALAHDVCFPELVQYGIGEAGAGTDDDTTRNKRRSHATPRPSTAGVSGRVCINGEAGDAIDESTPAPLTPRTGEAGEQSDTAGGVEHHSVGELVSQVLGSADVEVEQGWLKKMERLSGEITGPLLFASLWREFQDLGRFRRVEKVSHFI